jgi:hypothetical protein
MYVCRITQEIEVLTITHRRCCCLTKAPELHSTEPVLGTATADDGAASATPASDLNFSNNLLHTQTCTYPHHRFSFFFLPAIALYIQRPSTPRYFDWQADLPKKRPVLKTLPPRPNSSCRTFPHTPRRHLNPPPTPRLLAQYLPLFLSPAMKKTISTHNRNQRHPPPPNQPRHWQEP